MKGEHPLGRAPDQRQRRRSSHRRLEGIMRVDDRAERVRRGQVRDQLRGDRGGQREHHRLVLGDDLLALAPVERRHAVFVETDGPQAGARRERHVPRGQPAQRRVYERRRQRRFGDHRPHRAPAARYRLAQERRGQPCRSGTGFGVERAGQERFEQPRPKRAIGWNARVDAVVAATEQLQQRQIVADARTGHPAMAAQHPPRHAAIVDPHRPAFAARHIHEGEVGVVGSDQRRVRADRPPKAGDGGVARRDEVVAVVDH